MLFVLVGGVFGVVEVECYLVVVDLGEQVFYEVVVFLQLVQCIDGVLVEQVEVIDVFGDGYVVEVVDGMVEVVCCLVFQLRFVGLVVLVYVDDFGILVLGVYYGGDYFGWVLQVGVYDNDGCVVGQLQVGCDGLFFVEVVVEVDYVDFGVVGVQLLKQIG